MAARAKPADPRQTSSPAKDIEYFVDLNPQSGDFRQDVLHGLSQRQKSIPPKFFYDEYGSVLFDRICSTPEYYLTRAEIDILNEALPELKRAIEPGSRIIEFGSGASKKIRLLLDGLPRITEYTAIDISRNYLIDAVRALARDYPALRVGAVFADILAPIDLPADTTGPGRSLGFFPGSTIGNFSAADALAFMRNARRLLEPDGMLLVGVDLKKDRAVLERAYNDGAGITAAFNLNLLRRINRELGADFNLGEFRHKAVYDEARGRIEMHLVARSAQSVTVDGHRFRFRAGDTIHTENSYKYTVEEFDALVRKAGYETLNVWTGRHRLFSLHLLGLARL